MYKLLIMLCIGLNLYTQSVQDTPNKSKFSQSNLQFQEQLGKVLQASQFLQEAFIASDAKKVQQVASTVQKALSQIDMNLLQGKAHTDWIKLEKEIRSSLDKIESESKLKAQRQSFASFSQALYQSIKAFGITGEKVYYQYCPMALEGEGAYWLSQNKSIRNPYLGDNMLTCGSTKEVIQ